jgi:hypothetical protein
MDTGGFGTFPLERIDIAHGGSECNAAAHDKRVGKVRMLSKPNRRQ